MKNTTLGSLSESLSDQKFSREFLVITALWPGHLAFLVASKRLFD
jgi:hypothetical protein